MKTIWVTGCAGVMLFCGCTAAQQALPDTSVEELRSIATDRWNSVAGKRIFFGHQSVGYNLVEGLELAMRQEPRIRLRIHETRVFDDFKGGFFVHARIGKNRDPYAKADDFKVLLNSQGSASLDFAFFKFCYVDITRETDTEAVFAYYTGLMDTLEQRYPRIKFLHCTVPLTAAKTGFKALIMKSLGRKDANDQDNARRHQFNMRLREKYAAAGTLFDLAACEAQVAETPSGRVAGGTQTYETLAPELTYDGGHLNDTGKLHCAKALLLFLQRQIN